MVEEWLVFQQDGQELQLLREVKEFLRMDLKASNRNSNCLKCRLLLVALIKLSSLRDLNQTTQLQGNNQRLQSH